MLTGVESGVLVSLKWQTIAKYGQGNEAREAKEMMAGMREARLHKEAKGSQAHRQLVGANAYQLSQ